MHGTPDTRKALGAFYTPGPVARHVVATALRWLFDGASPRASLRVLDPACGDGEFLVQAIPLVLDHARDGSLTPGSRVTLAGIDVDPSALERAGERLRAAIPAPSSPAVSFSIELHRGNAVDPAVAATRARSFDVVVGNPPYVAWRAIPPAYRRPLERGCFLDATFACRPRHADAQPNLYLFFLVLASNLVSDRGVVSYLLPQEWMHHPRAGSFREHVVQHFARVAVVELDHGLRLFTSPGDVVSTTSMILTAGRCNDGHGSITGASIGHAFVPGMTVTEVLGQLGPSILEHRDVPVPVPPSGPWAFTSTGLRAIAGHVDSLDTVSLGEESCFHVFGGFQPPVRAARSFEVDVATRASLGKDTEGMVLPLLHDARDFRRYLLPAPTRYWIVANDVAGEADLVARNPRLHALLASRLDTRRARWWAFPNVRNLDVIKASEKILCPRTARVPTFAIDRQGFVFKGTNTAIACKDPALPAPYVTGILNSSLAKAWYDASGPAYHGRAAMRYEPSMVRRHAIPLKRPSGEGARQMVALVEDMLVAVRLGDGASQLGLQDAIDALAFDLYELSPSQRDAIQLAATGVTA